MNVGVVVPIKVLNAMYLIDEAQQLTGKKQSRDESLISLFSRAPNTPSFRITAVEVRGKGPSLSVGLVAEILDQSAFQAEALEAWAQWGGDDEEFDAESMHRCLYELAFASNDNASPDELGIAIGEFTRLSDSEMKALLVQNVEQSHSL